MRTEANVRHKEAWLVGDDMRADDMRADDMRADDMRADDMRAADCASRTEPQVRAPGSDDPEELFDLVDLHDRVIGQIRRSDAHRNPALLHRSVQILVFARDGRLLLQRRSQTKDLFPGYYCASASGHVASGEEYAAAARREIVEELGIAPKLRYVGKALVRSEPETELTALFLARCDGPFAFSPTETVGGAFFTLSELRAHRDNESLPLTPAAQVALDELDRLAREGILDAYLAGEQSP